MQLEILRDIGLSEGEIRVYNALLDNGRSSLNKIHESVRIERRNIYDILNKLIERGLVAYVTENKRRQFQIAHPKNIIGYLEQKKHNIDLQQKKVEEQIPSLISKFNLTRSDINAEIFRGKEGIKAVWEDSLNYKNIYWIGSRRYIQVMMPEYWGNYHLRRIKKKIVWHNLMRAELKNKINLYKYEKMKFLPKAFSGNPTVICIFGNKTVNFVLGDELFAFVIDCKELADNYRRYHSYLWNNVSIF